MPRRPRELGPALLARELDARVRLGRERHALGEQPLVRLDLELADHGSSRVRTSTTRASSVSSPRARAADTRWWPSTTKCIQPTRRTWMGGSDSPERYAAAIRSQRARERPEVGRKARSSHAGGPRCRPRCRAGRPARRGRARRRSRRLRRRPRSAAPPRSCAAPGSAPHRLAPPGPREVVGGVGARRARARAHRSYDSLVRREAPSKAAPSRARSVPMATVAVTPSGPGARGPRRPCALPRRYSHAPAGAPAARTARRERPPQRDQVADEVQRRPRVLALLGHVVGAARQPGRSRPPTVRPRHRRPAGIAAARVVAHVGDLHVEQAELVAVIEERRAPQGEQHQHAQRARAGSPCAQRVASRPASWLEPVHTGQAAAGIAPPCRDDLAQRLGLERRP